MKKYCFGMVMMWVIVGVWQGARCQEMVVQIGGESRHVSPVEVVGSHYLGAVSGLECWLTNGTEDGFFSRRRAWQVMMADSNLVALQRVTVKGSERWRPLAGAVVGDSAVVLMVDSSAAERVVVHRVACHIGIDAVSTKTGKEEAEESLVEDAIVASYGSRGEDHTLVWSATSPGGAYIGVLAVTTNDATERYTSDLVLFDGALRRVWSHSAPIGTTERLYVSDDGRMVTVGVERDGEDQRVVVNVADSRDVSTLQSALPSSDPLRSMDILGVVGDRLVCGGLYRPADSDTDEGVIGGVVALAYDLRAGSLVGIDIRPFENEDMNIFLNKKTKKRQRSKELPLIGVVGHCPTPWGGVLVVGRNYAESRTTGNGTVQRTYHAIGLHVVGVDTTGMIRWVRNVRRNDVSEEVRSDLFVGLQPMGSHTLLLKSEHAGYPTHYDIAAAAKEYECGSKCNIVVYRFDADGEVEKGIVEKKSRHTLIGVDRRGDGALLLLSRRGAKTRMGILNHNSQ